MATLLDRYTGPDGPRLLLSLLRGQILAGGNPAIAEDLLTLITPRELAVGELLIRQGDPDNDVYLILIGRVKVLIHDRQVAVRETGQHVGEMVAINPAMVRTATVIAVEPTVVGMISEPDFMLMLRKYPAMWEPIALELSRRLDERKRFHKEPNKLPILFIGSSSESLPIAKALAASISPTVAHVVLWSVDVFGASHFPIEDLEAKVETADLAVLVCAGDDQVVSRGTGSEAPRDNVIFELGLFMGSLTRHRTFILEPSGKKIKVPTDLLGINSLKYDPNAKTPDEAVSVASKELIGLIQAKGPK